MALRHFWMPQWPHIFYGWLLTGMIFWWWTSYWHRLINSIRWLRSARLKNSRLVSFQSQRERHDNRACICTDCRAYCNVYMMEKAIRYRCHRGHSYNCVGDFPGNILCRPVDIPFQAWSDSPAYQRICDLICRWSGIRPFRALPHFLFLRGAGLIRALPHFFIGDHLYEHKSKIPAFQDAAAWIESLGRPNRKGGALNVSHKKTNIFFMWSKLVFLAPPL